jgi:hypothetical protein
MKVSKLFAISSLICLSVVSSVSAQTAKDAEGHYKRNKVSVTQLTPIDELLGETQFEEYFENPEFLEYNKLEVKIKATSPSCKATILNVSNGEIFGRVEYTFSELESPEEFSVLASCGKNKKAQVFVEIWASTSDTEEGVQRWKKKLWIYRVRPIGSKGGQTPFSKMSRGSSSSSSSSTTTTTTETRYFWRRSW